MPASSPDPLTRREALGMLGVAGLAALTGRAPDVTPAGALADQFDCVVTPAQTQGPYFVDERLERADVRLDPLSGIVSKGVPLRLGLTVARVDGVSCAPVAGALVDVWQCDALGVYSDVRDANGLFDTRGKKFLRGYQRTDRGGKAEFLTVYPGWYRGRTVHIHFKVRVVDGDRASHEFTSQLYFDDAVTDLVHAKAPYHTKGMRDTRNDLDGIYRQRNSGAGLMLRLAPEGAGYRANIAVGLRMT